MKAKIGKSYLTEIPHEGGEISFQHPSFRGIYGSVAEQIDSEGLKRPSSPETASLVYDAFQNPEGQYESEIIDILKNRWLWEFTGNLYLPKSNEEVNNGVILERNPEIPNGRLNMNKESLVRRLQENDPLVKFVPFGYETGTQGLKDFEKNPYIVARYGGEGAQKITEVASKYKNKPRVWTPDSVGEEVQRMSALYRGWNLGVDGLSVGDGWGDGDDGHAFGVVPNKSE